LGSLIKRNGLLADKIINNILIIAQQHQPELLFTSCSSISSPASPISLTLSSPAIIATHQSTGSLIATGNNSNASTNAVAAGMGSKRGRLLIRQQRIKKDGDQTGDLETPEAGIYQEYLLSVPSSSSSSSGAKMERHASEPSPASSGLISSSPSISSNLLTVPQQQHSSYLVKQHSHPLLPSQSSTPNTTYAITRQLSQPIQTISHLHTQQSTTQIVSTHGTQDILASGQLLQLHQHRPPTVRSQTMPHYTVTDMELGSSVANEKAQITQQQQQQQQQQHTISNSPTVVIIPDLSSDQSAATTITQQQNIYQKSSSHHLQLPSIRVKSEELQRSVSSPLVNI
jgi:hypothetical protein